MRKLIPVAIVLLVAAGIWYVWPPEKQDDQGLSDAPARTAADYQRDLELRTQGISRIENLEWDEADRTFLELREHASDELLPVRNLAIARTLSMIAPGSPYERVKDPKSYADAFSRALEAIEALKQFDAGEEPMANLLLGKLLVHDGQSVEGVRLLKSAAEAMPDRGDLWFAVYQAAQTDADLQQSPEVVDALAKAHAAMPTNLFVLQARLSLLAMKKDPALAEVMRSALELIEPLEYPAMESITTRIREAMASYDGGDTASLELAARLTSNVLRAQEPTGIDRRRADWNLLEYLVPDFSQEYREAAIKAGVAPVATETSTIVLSNVDLLPDLESVTQAEMADINLDGIDDLVVARDGRIEVYTRAGDESGWSLLMQTANDAAVRLSHFRLFDIDRDFDRSIDMKSARLLLDPDGDRKLPADASGQPRWYDTDLDIIAWGETPESRVSLFRNEKANDGTRIAQELPLPEALSALTNVTDIRVVDLEHDGDLDLVAAASGRISLWRNKNGSEFESMERGVQGSSENAGILAAVDWNQDLAIDVPAVALDGDDHRGGYLQNSFHGRFRWLQDRDAAVLADIEPGRTMCVHDFDGNVSWDLLVAGERGVTAWLTHIAEDGTVGLLQREQLTSEPTSGAVVVDLDNDGFLDVVAWSARGLETFRGLPSGKFGEFEAIPQSPDGIQGVSTADLDRDGDMDLLVITDGKLQSLINEGGEKNNWIEIVLRADQNPEQFPSNRCNMHAFGAIVEVRTGALYQSRIVDQPRIHFGIGEHEKIDAVRIIWTDGIPQNVIAADLLNSSGVVMAPQILGGSCPYIYTWTGEQFEFFSDCLWAAPLGLVQATGDLAPTREWEHLLIPGEHLAAKDGRYVIQLTEELHEAAYFDEVKLMAVDHPADVEIFTNEKVGPPGIAAPMVHTVTHRVAPLSAIDGDGHDVTTAVAEQDGHYVQAFRGRIVQGLTDPWSLEFDFGTLADVDSAKLILVGWVFPTDTNLNTAIHQNDKLEAPAPPSIQTIGEDGEWKNVMPFAGFPGGKTKTIVIDLSGRFATDDHRIRLSSSMELYWDAAFLVSGEQSVSTRQHACDLVFADVHYRGFSRRRYADSALFRNGLQPEDYDYSRVTTEPRWPPMQGRFTRYGDVLELVTAHDDLSVILAPGDELTVEFAVPEQRVPAGWKRDFVLYNVGWDKDAHLNTISGQTSEPFPSASMSRYPFEDDPGSNVSAETGQRNVRWQTRRLSSRKFRRLVRDGGTMKSPFGGSQRP